MSAFTRDDMKRALTAAIAAMDGKNVYHNGYDAEFWHGSYKLLRDAVDEHLGTFVHGDDVAEEAIYIEAIKLAGNKLAPPQPPAGADVRDEDVAAEVVRRGDRMLVSTTILREWIAAGSSVVPVLVTDVRLDPVTGIKTLTVGPGDHATTT
jgi:hypothetical protein